MNDLETSVNNSEVAEPITGNTGNETVTDVSGGAVDPQQNQRPAQSAEDNARYAAIRRQTEQKVRDSVIAELLGDQGITSYQQYQEALQVNQRAAEAQERGIDPSFYNEFNSVKDELSSLKRERTLISQDAQLSNDPSVGPLYNEWKNDVHQVANEYNVDYDTAFTILTRERLHDIIGKTRITTEQNTLKGLTQNAQTTPGALSGGGIEPKQDFSKMSSKDFAEYTEKALRGELSKF